MWGWNIASLLSGVFLLLHYLAFNDCFVVFVALYDASVSCISCSSSSSYSSIALLTAGLRFENQKSTATLYNDKSTNSTRAVGMSDSTLPLSGNIMSLYIMLGLRAGVKTSHIRNGSKFYMWLNRFCKSRGKLFISIFHGLLKKLQKCHTIIYRKAL